MLSNNGVKNDHLYYYNKPLTIPADNVKVSIPVSIHATEGLSMNSKYFFPNHGTHYQVTKFCIHVSCNDAVKLQKTIN
jgi:hypothetical protein